MGNGDQHWRDGQIRRLKWGCWVDGGGTPWIAGGLLNGVDTKCACMYVCMYVCIHVCWQYKWNSQYKEEAIPSSES